jgi:hypothetical protein
MSEKKYIEPGRRFMDVAWLRDGDSIYTGEAMMLAVLLHTRGKGRTQEHERELARLLDDPNQKIKKKLRKG